MSQYSNLFAQAVNNNADTSNNGNGTNNNQQRTPRKMYINIGRNVMYKDPETGTEEPVFVNIPVVISVDDIAKQIKSIKQDASPKWKLIQGGRNRLAQDVIDLFSNIPSGEEVLQQSLPEKSLLANVQLQFLHAGEIVQADVSETDPFADFE